MAWSLFEMFVGNIPMICLIMEKRTSNDKSFVLSLSVIIPLLLV